VKLAILHTVASLVLTFRALTDELLPTVDVFNIVDEGLLRQAIADGGMTPALGRRVMQQLWAAQDGGADVILISCSSIGSAADRARGLVAIPVVRVDEAMARRAVAVGRRIGVLATLKSTLVPTTDLIRRIATDASRDVEIAATVADGAFECATRGDLAGHDRLVRDALEALLGVTDVVVLAQASMARAAATLNDKLDSAQILTSPRLAVEQLAQMNDDAFAVRAPATASARERHGGDV
jgi:Asp/Glu/hydantoin racemase